MQETHSPDLAIMRAATETQIAELVAPVLTQLGYELVRVQLAGARGGLTLQLMAERADGKAMMVEDCRAITNGVDLLLDEADPIPGAYALEVSSPGIDRPLTRPKDYQNWAGHIVKIGLRQPRDGRKNFQGVLNGLDGENVKLTVDQEPVMLPLAAIAKAQLVLTDELIAATAQKEALAAGLPLPEKLSAKKQPSKGAAKGQTGSPAARKQEPKKQDAKKQEQGRKRS